MSNDNTKEHAVKNRDSEQSKKTSKHLVSVQRVVAVLITITAASILIYLFPENREGVLDTSLRFFYEMISILPAIVIMIGLFTVFVSKQMVANYLGHASGPKGFLLAIILGALPTGPLYVAFPLASAMLKKGARVANIIVFLTAWACVKLPQELVELQFMGLEFTLFRFGLTIVAAVLMGIVIEGVMETIEQKEK